MELHDTTTSPKRSLSASSGLMLLVLAMWVIVFVLAPNGIMALVSVGETTELGEVVFRADGRSAVNAERYTRVFNARLGTALAVSLLAGTLAALPIAILHRFHARA